MYFKISLKTSIAKFKYKSYKYGFNLKKKAIYQFYLKARKTKT